MTRKPVVLLMGDSTTVHVAERITAKLVDVAQVEVSSVGNGNNFLSKIDELTGGVKPNLIYFNCGLHDLARHRDTRVFQGYGSANRATVLEAYRGNLRGIVRALKGKGAKGLVWGTTTPVIFERHRRVKKFDRDEDDVAAFDEVALAVMRESGLTVHDRHRVIMDAGVEECLRDDGVHMTERGLEVLATAVADFIRKHLEEVSA